MSNDEQYDFSKLYRNRLEKRIVEYLETCANLYNDNLELSIQAQMALVGKSIENIALMMMEQGYVANNGRFVRFSPNDLLTIQNALSAAIRMRADIMMLPMGLEALTKTAKSLDSLSTPPAGKSNPGTGLSQPPPLKAVDIDPPEEEQNIKDQTNTMQVTLLPAKKTS